MSTSPAAPSVSGRPWAARTAALVMAVAIAFLVGACAKPVPSRTELVDALQTSGIAASEARCAADAILKNLSSDQVAAIVERGPSGVPADDPKRTDDPSDKVRAALAACRAAAPTSSTSTSTLIAPSVPTSVSAPTTNAAGGSAVIVTHGAVLDTVPAAGAGSSVTTAAP